MKFQFGLLLVSVVTLQGETAVLKSSVKDGIVKALYTVNGLFSEVSNYANNYFLDSLKNYTGIQEWSVNVQDKVITDIAEVGFDVFSAYESYISTIDPTETELKLLGCVADQKSNVLAFVSNASRQNGWCNNRLAGNLSVALQEVSQDLVKLSKNLDQNIKSLNSCFLGDDLCLASFLTKIVALIQAEIGTSGTLVTGLKHVYGIYKIMFGQDVPACNEKYLFPLLLNGIQTTFHNVGQCLVA